MGRLRYLDVKARVFHLGLEWVHVYTLSVDSFPYDKFLNLDVNRTNIV